MRVFFFFWFSIKKFVCDGLDDIYASYYEAGAIFRLRQINQVVDGHTVVGKALRVVNVLLETETADNDYSFAHLFICRTPDGCHLKVKVCEFGTVSIGLLALAEFEAMSVKPFTTTKAGDTFGSIEIKQA